MKKEKTFSYKATPLAGGALQNTLLDLANRKKMEKARKNGIMY